MNGKIGTEHLLVQVPTLYIYIFWTANIKWTQDNIYPLFNNCYSDLILAGHLSVIWDFLAFSRDELCIASPICTETEIAPYCILLCVWMHE